MPRSGDTGATHELDHSTRSLTDHEIASISYVRDDDDHLLFLKAGKHNEQVCSVYVFSCVKQVRVTS